MEPAAVLVFSCPDELVTTPDERAITALQVPVISAFTGLVTRNRENDAQVTKLEPSVVTTYLNEVTRNKDVKVVKIGALFSVETIQTVSSILQQSPQPISVLDVEPFFKTGPSPTPEMITALRKDVLPLITLASMTVREAIVLQLDAGLPAPYPASTADVGTLAKAVATWGPKYVMIKREDLDEFEGKTTLHYVLCTGGDAEPIVVATRCENPKRFFGASYSIPPAIAAYLAQRHDVPEAVSAGFKFVEEKLKGGEYFE